MDRGRRSIVSGQQVFSNRSLLTGLCAILSTLLLGACHVAPNLAEAVSVTDDSYSVVVSGHLYSLYVRNKHMVRDEVVFDEAPLEAYAAELDRINPKAVFFLGDNTRWALPEEWQMIDRVFGKVDAQKIFVAGNHDHLDIQTFEERGGLRNGSVVIGRNKFIVLDSKTVFDQTDLAFIESEVADYENYDNVFIMMHFILIGAKSPQGESEPYGQYDNQSNWNRDVLPLIAGKVSYVFSGDYYPGHVGRMVQHYAGHQINYIRNAFLFRRGRENDQTGDGPMIYLELRFEGEDFSILPHALPVDLKSSWYEDFNVPDRFKPDYIFESRQFIADWKEYPIDEAFDLPLPVRWTIQPSRAGALLTAQDQSGSVNLSVYRYELEPGTSLFDFSEQLQAEARRSKGSELSIEERGLLRTHNVQTYWTISELFRNPKSESGLNLWFIYRGTGYLITCQLPSASNKYRQRVTELFTLFTAINAIEFPAGDTVPGQNPPG